jgi:hypothetical protein
MAATALRVFQPSGDAFAAAPLGRAQLAAVDVLVDVLVLVLVEDVVEVLVDVVVVVEVLVVVVVHGAVTVTVVGWVTVTLTVFVLRFGHAPRLSPRRRCARTALWLTRIVASVFDPVR